MIYLGILNHFRIVDVEYRKILNLLHHKVVSAIGQEASTEAGLLGQ